MHIQLLKHCPRVRLVTGWAAAQVSPHVNTPVAGRQIETCAVLFMCQVETKSLSPCQKTLASPGVLPSKHCGYTKHTVYTPVLQALACSLLRLALSVLMLGWPAGGRTCTVCWSWSCPLLSWLHRLLLSAGSWARRLLRSAGCWLSGFTSRLSCSTERKLLVSPAQSDAADKLGCFLSVPHPAPGRQTLATVQTSQKSRPEALAGCSRWRRWPSCQTPKPSAFDGLTIALFFSASYSKGTDKRDCWLVLAGWQGRPGSGCSRWRRWPGCHTPKPSRTLTGFASRSSRCTTDAGAAAGASSAGWALLATCKTVELGSLQLVAQAKPRG